MFDFDTRPERRHTTSAKWKLIEDELGAGHDDVVAMSVADMEFVPAPQVVDAIVDAARHDVFGYDYATDAYYDAVVGSSASSRQVTPSARSAFIIRSVSRERSRPRMRTGSAPSAARMR